jgi:DNA end-binding protein Ku
MAKSSSRPSRTRKPAPRKRAARKSGSRKRAAPAAADGSGSAGVPEGPRPLWSGTVTFALVSVPVDLYPASRDSSVRMKLLAPDGTPLESRWYCPEHDQEIEWSEIDRAEETEQGYVVLTDEELEAIEPRRSRDIEVETFVPLAGIEPPMVERAFVLTPSSGSSKPYRLLARALEDAGLAGLATFVLRRRERLTAVVARGGVLWAVALRFRDDVRTPADVGLAEGERAPAARTRELRAALRALTRERWSSDELQDEESDGLRELVEAKRRRGEDLIEVPLEPEDEDAAVEGDGEAAGTDLLEVIRERLQGPARSTRRAQPAGSKQVDLAALSRQELLRRARDADLAGRSRMTKDELAAALSRAG